MTKRMLADAMIELMGKKPINRISIKEICELADVNRSTFYAYYTDIFMLLTSIENEFISKLPSIYANSIEELNSELEIFLEYLYTSRTTLQVLLRNSSAEDLRNKIINAVFDQYSKHEKAPTKLDIENDHQIQLYVYTAGCFSVVVKWILGEIEATPKLMANKLGKFLIA